ncbi:NAD-dependent succinate-semialdehyde dehydrogenase [Glaciecola sp. 1036]|uniref:NAD-dependent succinate-semialdehyde dehydrogenase n=1 Tax=Alteromonadaceae TaxID=72275 RepID=UPI003D00F0F9
MKLTELPIFKQSCLLNGQWYQTDATSNVENPATGQVIGRVPVITGEQVNKAIDDAESAFKLWRKKTPQHRSELLQAWFNEIQDHEDELAFIMTCEQGKPLHEAKAEIAYAASYVRWFAQEAVRIEGESLGGLNNDQKIIVSRDPVGVCAAITPWNFPAAMITRKVAPALAAGCTMLVKPAQQTPFTALALAALACKAGLPDGVLQVVTGKAAEIGEAFTSNSKVRKLSFTGSTKIGSLLMQQCAKDVKKISLELGGNAPLLIFEDTNVDFVADELIKAKFRNAGQTCISPNRVYVQSSIYQAFCDALVAKVAKLKLGDGLSNDTDIGPLIDQSAVNKVKEHIDDALAKGAKLLCGGIDETQEKLWVAPTVLSDVPSYAKCCVEETFGPLVPLISFDNEQQALAYANDTEFGLAAYLFSDNIHQVQRIVDGIESGMVGINTGVISAANAPFGGVKASGIGREGAHIGIEEYLEMKYQCYGQKGL